MAEKTVEPRELSGETTTFTGRQILSSHRSNELFIAIVGPAGAGAGTSAKILKTYFEEVGYETEIVKASSLIRQASEQAGLDVPATDGRKSIASISTMQDRGDDLRLGKAFGREEDHSAIARLIMHQMPKLRASVQGGEFTPGIPIEPDEKQRAYIIDSLRHPAEVFLLRQVYQDAFSLIGVVCDPQVRESRIRENLFDRNEWGNEETRGKVREFIDRDENAPEGYGQHVSDTFHQADYFVDNSDPGEDDLSITGMNDQLKRFVSLLIHQRIVRPSIAETAMHHARSAQLRSACLSRQVGAALVDPEGNIVATGTNEVPKAGGGVYGESFDQASGNDYRCAFREEKFCSSNREQNAIIEDLIKEFPALTSEKDAQEVVRAIRSTRIGGLIEFSRAVHAEMDAILSASRIGVPTVGARLFVTTYPCHYCARHIIASGIDEVQFIEPYPKSRASALHSDSITMEQNDWKPPSSSEGGKVLFRPFVGVSPRIYRRVFMKDRDYKDEITGTYKIGEPKWGGPLDTYRLSYTNLEIELGREMTDD